MATVDGGLSISENSGVGAWNAFRGKKASSRNYHCYNMELTPVS